MTILSTTPPAVRPRFAVPRYASWQEAMKDAVRDPDELCRLLDLPAEFAERRKAAARQFPLFVPRGFVARMRPGDPTDPLLRQVLPLADEMADVPGFVADPVGDDAADAAAWAAAKVSLAACCSSRPARAPCIAATASAGIFRTTRRRARSTIGSRRSTRSRPTTVVHEVILSGGDPLTLVDATLAAIDRRNWPRFHICGGCGFTRGCRS